MITKTTIKNFIDMNSAAADDTDATVKAYWDKNQIKPSSSNSVLNDFAFIDGSSNLVPTPSSGASVSYANHKIMDIGAVSGVGATNRKGIIRLEFTFTADESDKYKITNNPINVYIELQGT